MTCCEKCWTDAGGDAMAYAVLVRERTESGESCTPQEQCGERHAKDGDGLCVCQRAAQSTKRKVRDAERMIIAAADSLERLAGQWGDDADVMQFGTFRLLLAAVQELRKVSA